MCLCSFLPREMIFGMMVRVFAIVVEGDKLATVVESDQKAPILDIYNTKVYKMALLLSLELLHFTLDPYLIIPY